MSKRDINERKDRPFSEAAGGGNESSVNPARKTPGIKPVPTRDAYDESDYGKAFKLLRDYLFDGDAADLDKLKEMIDKSPLAFNNFEQGESVLFNVISTMLQGRELRENNAADVAERLDAVLKHAHESYGREFVRRMVNTRCHPESIMTDNHLTVRDLMEKGKMMSYIAVREFFGLFDQYKFETTKVRGL